MRRQLTRDDVEPAVLGGALLGGGGGGHLEEGRAFGELAVLLGEVELWTLDELQEGDLLATAGLVGAPAAREGHVAPADHVRAAQVLQGALGAPIRGIVTNEMGPFATVNGWLQAAMLAVPVVDAPCDGRAHPTGVMGAAGLHRQMGYVSLQAAVGGRGERRIEAMLRGPLAAAAAGVRALSVAAGGLVAVARNPVSAAYAKEHCALGAVGEAMALGAVALEHRGAVGEALAAALMEHLGGEICGLGEVTDVRLETVGGFDVGLATVGDLELSFWNEYMTLERRGRRLGTFPDLIATLDLASGLPLATADLQTGRRVAVVRVPKERLRLGAGVRDPELLRAVEAAIGREVVRYACATDGAGAAGG